MVDFALSDEQKAIRDTARAFVSDEIVPREPEVCGANASASPASPVRRGASCSSRPASSASGGCRLPRRTAAWICRP